MRLDKAVAAAVDVPGLSRSRISRLIAEGCLRGPDGGTLEDPARKVKPGLEVALTLPSPVDAEPAPEAIPLDIVHEDRDLIVVNKPAGMVVHPAPGAETGTLVNALLAHCGRELAGIGGTRRPGIVHRIDKLTSGLLVVAKTEAAHAGLSTLFACHDIHRRYLALARGAPDRADPRLGGIAGVHFEADGTIRVEAAIARHPTDRKRMAVTRSGGRHAVSRFRVQERFGPGQTPVACLMSCTLETGRTHQIRVHARHIGHPLIGDPVYGTRSMREPALQAFPRVHVGIPVGV